MQTRHSNLYYVTLKVLLNHIEKPMVNDRLRVSKVSRVFCIQTIYNFAIIYLPVKFAIFLKSNLLFNSFHCLSCLSNNFTAQ